MISLDLGHEAQVGHVVGLVEHDNPDLTEVDRTAVGEVHEASRRGHHDVQAPLERPRI